MQISKILKIARRVAYLVLPVILLWIIFKRIDISLLMQNLNVANPYLILLAILIRPVQILAGSVRWYFLTRFYSKSEISLSYITQQYWGSMVIGFITPGSVGWDAYRIAVLGKKLQKYTVAFITILAEKLAGLVSVLLLALGLFPFVSDHLIKNRSLFWEIYTWVVVGILVFLVALILIKRLNLPFGRVGTFYSKKLQRKVLNALSNKSIQSKIRKDLERSISIFSIFQKPKVLIITLIFSLSNIAVAAVCSYIIFTGLNYDISFLINLFAAPVFFLIFIIPISIGSIGVREGAYILLYGQFGVPVEIALLVSFFNLFGIIVNNIIGAGFLFTKGLKQNLPSLKKL